MKKKDFAASFGCFVLDTSVTCIQFGFAVQIYPIILLFQQLRVGSYKKGLGREGVQRLSQNAKENMSKVYGKHW